MTDNGIPTAPKKFFCDKATMKVHDTSSGCPDIKQNKPHYEFDNLEDALKAGYSQCPACFVNIRHLVGPSPSATRRIEGMRYESKNLPGPRENKMMNGPRERKG